MNTQTVVLVGPPGSGKKTVATALEEMWKPNVRRVDVAGIFSELRFVGLGFQEPEAEEIDAVLNSGGSIPDEIICRVVSRAVSIEPSKNIIVENPQTVRDAEVIMGFLRGSHRENITIIFVATSLAICHGRLLTSSDERRSWYDERPYESRADILRRFELWDRSYARILEVLCKGSSLLVTLPSVEEGDMLIGGEGCPIKTPLKRKLDGIFGSRASSVPSNSIIQ